MTGASAGCSSTGLSSGKKSILSAAASFAAVRNEKFTSCRSTFVIYGRDTSIRRASSVWLTPSSFMRRSICRKNAEPILSIEFIEGVGELGCEGVRSGWVMELVWLLLIGECFAAHSSTLWFHSKDVLFLHFFHTIPTEP